MPWNNPIRITVVLCEGIKRFQEKKRCWVLFTTTELEDLTTQHEIMGFKALDGLALDYLSSMFTERSRSGYL